MTDHSSISPAQKWLDEMQLIWIEKRPNDIGALLSNAFEYHETPFTPPLTSKKEVINAWQEILSQNIEFVHINVLHEDNRTATATWDFKMHDAPLHRGSYFLRLDDQGKCIEFRQWWNVA